MIKASNSLVRIIIGISIAIPLLVAILMFTSVDLGLSGAWVKSLPTLNAILNSATALCLIVAVVFVRRKQIGLHKMFMSLGLFMGALFLISYVIYHSNATTVIYGDINHDGILSSEELVEVGLMRQFYVFTLASHIILSIVVIPFVLSAFYFALTGQIPNHRTIVKYTFPIWLYVSITGVMVYFMIAPFYL